MTADDLKKSGFLPIARAHLAGADGTPSSPLAERPHANTFVGQLWREARSLSRFEAFLWLRAEAAYGGEGRQRTVKTTRGPVQITEPRGSLVVSTAQLAEAWGWPPKRVQHFLAQLEDAGELALQEHPSWRLTGRRLALLNYDAYTLATGAAYVGEGTTDLPTADFAGYTPGETRGDTQVEAITRVTGSFGYTPGDTPGDTYRKEQGSNKGSSISAREDELNGSGVTPISRLDSDDPTLTERQRELHRALEARERDFGPEAAMQLAVTVAVNQGAEANPRIGRRHVPISATQPSGHEVAVDLLAAAVPRRFAMTVAYKAMLQTKAVGAGGVRSIGYVKRVILEQWDRERTKRLSALGPVVDEQRQASVDAEAAERFRQQRAADEARIQERLREEAATAAAGLEGLSLRQLAERLASEKVLR